MGDQNLKNESLDAHNKYRKAHGAPPLKWSTKLESNAQNWANELAKRQTLQHASQQEEGENLSYAMGKELTGQYATDMWYDEVKKYNFDRPGFTSGAGHFTQVVWAGSRELGVAKAVSESGQQYIVARYYPPGNNMRTFKENVFPKGSKLQSIQPNDNKGKDATVTVSPNEQRGDNTIASPKKRKGKAFNDPKSPKKQKVDITVKPAAGSAFQNAFLKSHNMYRKRHGAVPLKWNYQLAKAATDAAEEACNTNTLRALDMENVGQSMIVRSNGELTGEDVSSVWYNEESKFNYDSPGFSSETGKFSQMVWKETKEVGAGVAFNRHGQTFVIALYQPPGNVRGNFPENVARPRGSVRTGGESATKCRCAIM